MIFSEKGTPRKAWGRALSFSRSNEKLKQVCSREVVRKGRQLFARDRDLPRVLCGCGGMELSQKN